MKIRFLTSLPKYNWRNTPWLCHGDSQLKKVLYCNVTPPSMVNTDPVTHLDASDSKYIQP